MCPSYFINASTASVELRSIVYWEIQFRREVYPLLTDRFLVFTRQGTSGFHHSMHENGLF